MSVVVSAKGVEKKFGDFTAVKNTTLNIRQGECFGLLGPNGAGKSTFINMLYGVVRRTSGELKIFHMDPNIESRSIKKRVGVVTQENALDESLTVWENMMIYAAFLSIPREKRKDQIDSLLKFMNLDHKKEANIRHLSGGMRRRLVFVRALMGNPEFIVLDEPTTGLDPAVRHLLWGKVKELKNRGCTILLTTHYMHEAEVLCDRLVIMNKGDVIAEGTPKELINKYTPGYVAVYSAQKTTEEQINSLSTKKPNFLFSKDSTGFHLRAPTLKDLIDSRQEITSEPDQIRPANLEDVFLKTTGQELSADD
ncbi:MAG: ABC transporter [Proteobacteria bacterium SG_bin7]|nr:MAG: ABC transporter [Proteobacteria bacterium SG_bin7]